MNSIQVIGIVQAKSGFQVCVYQTTNIIFHHNFRLIKNKKPLSFNRGL